MPTAAVNFSVLTKPPSGSTSFGYSSPLYHQQAYIDSQPAPPACSFWLCSEQSNRISNVIHFYRQGDTAISQLFAPFGSFNDAILGEELGQFFLDSVLEGLVERGFKEIIIKHPADCYQEHHFWQTLLKRRGFSEQRFVNHHIPIDEIPFYEKIHKMERRKLAKSQHFHLKFVNSDSLAKAYNFIASCRKERGQNLSMTLPRLVKVVNAIPDKFLICLVDSGDKLAAAAIIIKVTPNCWYQFYPAHSKAFDKESPLVFLISGLYHEAYQQGVRVLDLGTSEVEGTSLEGLITFKTRMGGKLTYKRTYKRSL